MWKDGSLIVYILLKLIIKNTKNQNQRVAIWQQEQSETA